MEGSRWILVKVVLFQLRGCGHPQGDATPNFFPDSKSTIIGLSNEISFAFRWYFKISENWEKEESIIRPYVSKKGKLYINFCKSFLSFVFCFHYLICFIDNFPFVFRSSFSYYLKLCPISLKISKSGLTRCEYIW